MHHRNVSIPQAVWIACNRAVRELHSSFAGFQYRKRYGLHAIITGASLDAKIVVSIPQAVWIACNYGVFVGKIAPFEFQYRKRYGLHAIIGAFDQTHIPIQFQYRKRYGLHAIASQVMGHCRSLLFQYRKRYGLHAIDSGRRRDSYHGRFNTASGMDCMQYCLPEPLKTVNPKGGFLIRPLFLRLSPNLREFFVAKSGSKGVQSQRYQGNFCPRGKPKTHDIFSQISDFTVMKYSMKLKCCQYPLRNFFLHKRKGGNTHRERSRFFCRSYNVACSIFSYDGCSACGMPIISRADTLPASRRSLAP